MHILSRPSYFAVIPAIYAALLIPGARSENKIPAWPFVSASFFLGAFALVPYMALWQPKEISAAPPAASEFEVGRRLRIYDCVYMDTWIQVF